MYRYIPYIVALMAAYDFSLHIFDLLHVYRKTKIRHPFGAYLIFDLFASRDDLVKRRKVYQIFWNIYWGTATILMVIYLLNL